MRILVISDEIYPDAIGGVGKSLYNECVALVKRGHDVRVLVRASNYQLPPQTEINGLKIIRFFGPERHSVLYYLYPLAIIYKVAQWLRQFPGPYDILYLHNAVYVLPVLLTRTNRQAPTICTFYSAMDDYIQSNIQRGKYGRLTNLARIGAWIMGRIEGWALYRVDTGLPRSLYSLREMLRAYPKTTIYDAENLIPLGIDVNHYMAHPKLDARLRLNLPENRPIFITVRRLDGRMGLPNLIEAIKLVSEGHPDVLLLIAGKGYLRPVLDALILQHNLENHVRLLGYVSEDDLPLYLSASDAFVLATESQEGFGLATIEAMATSIPVIGTPIGATPEILAPIEPKLLTKDSSSSALAESISYWLDHRDELPALGEHCRAAVEAHYSADEVATQLETLFRALKQHHETQN
jgi:glycosyltransferase involved in cell wall biosynthesis